MARPRLPREQTRARGPASDRGRHLRIANLFGNPKRGKNILVTLAVTVHMRGAIGPIPTRSGGWSVLHTCMPARSPAPLPTIRPPFRPIRGLLASSPSNLQHKWRCLREQHCKNARPYVGARNRDAWAAQARATPSLYTSNCASATRPAPLPQHLQWLPTSTASTRAPRRTTST